MLVAFKDNGKTHLILIEAKAYSAWTNRQLESKMKHLTIFDDEKLRADCEPHFVLTSPTEPKKLKDLPYPEWMKEEGKMRDSKNPHWLQLSPRCKLLRVRRDGEKVNGCYSRLVVYEPNTPEDKDC